MTRDEWNREQRLCDAGGCAGVRPAHICKIYRLEFGQQMHDEPIGARDLRYVRAVPSPRERSCKATGLVVTEHGCRCE